MIAVYYDEATGDLYECCQGPDEHIEADGRPYVQVPEFRPDWRVTHKVVAGQLVERDQKDVEAETRAAAIRLIRARRDGLLRADVDLGPLRFAQLTDAQKAALGAYRQALLDFPEAVEDPFNPVWPEYPL